MWLAHALTLSRIPLGLALLWLWGDPAWSLALLALGAATDAADGTVARWARRKGLGGPDIGGWLDPAVDKLFVAMVLVAIWNHTHQLVVIALIGAYGVADNTWPVARSMTYTKPLRSTRTSTLRFAPSIGRSSNRFSLTAS